MSEEVEMAHLRTDVNCSSQILLLLLAAMQHPQFQSLHTMEYNERGDDSHCVVIVKDCKVWEVQESLAGTKVCDALASGD